MPGRSVVIGVVGKSDGCPTKAYDDALLVGAELTARGAVVLTGGSPDETKRTVKKGALERAGRQVSVLPGGGRGCVLENGRLRFQTSMSSHARNLLTGQVPDALIAVGGGTGTLSEVACALLAGRGVVLLGEASKDVTSSGLTTIRTGIATYWNADEVVHFDTDPQALLRACTVATSPEQAAAEAMKFGAARGGRWDWAPEKHPELHTVFRTFKALLHDLCA
jgi:uncharacterized protein (TIGR00725 family)